MEQELTSKGPFWLLEEGKALDSWYLKTLSLINNDQLLQIYITITSISK